MKMKTKITAWLHTDNQNLIDYMLTNYPGVIKENQVQKLKVEETMHYLFGPLEKDTLDKFIQEIQQD
jgi:hypothetical protein